MAALVLLAIATPACLWAARPAAARCAGCSVRRCSSVAGTVFLVLPQAHDRSSYQDLALVLGVLAPAGTLVFTRFVSGRPYETRESATDT